MLTLKETLAHFKINITPDFESTKMQREGAQWLRAYRFTLPTAGKEFLVVYFGDYKSGVNESWKSSTENYDPAQLKESKSAEREAAKAREKEIEEEQIRIKLEVEARWPNFTERGTTEYLERKKIDQLFGCKIDINNYGPYLLVPARDVNGVLWNYQRIYNKKLSAGDKFFIHGAKKKGLFHALTPIHPEGQIYICEGFATATSVAMALSSAQTVVAAFDTGNLLPVALSLRAKYPLASFIFCADDDAFTRKPDGSQWNPGVEYATEAAEKVGGIVLTPKFDSLSTKPTDFNDLHMLQGLASVTEQLKNPVPRSGDKTPAKGKVTEKQISEVILKKWGEDLIRQDKSLFRYTGTHWVELTDYDKDQIKNQINSACGNLLGAKTVDNIYRTFFRLVTHVPEKVNLFVPNSKCGNFLDGTLHLSLNERSGVYTLHFSDHKREDYLTWVVPVKYKCDRTLKNSLFEEMLSEALHGEEDEAGILRALKQMGGAMLVPTFSQMFFLYGISGSRKSTIALTLSKLIAEENVSACDPANMDNFEIEGMIGKLVNMHTDIDDHVPLPRGFLKRFADDTTVQVNRKSKTVVKAMLPRVHIYCANELPPNFEGQGKAFLRRLTLIKLKRDLTHDQDGRQRDAVKKDYQNLIWQAGPEGILNWCLEGLTDLVNSGGKFFQPMSSIAGGKEWQAKRDAVVQFIQSIEAGEVADKNAQIMLAEKARIKPSHLWVIFCDWHKIVFNFPPRLSRFKFYDSLEQHGFGQVKTRGFMHYAGIGVEEGANSEF